MAEPLWSEDSFYVKEKKKWDTPRNEPVRGPDGRPVLDSDGTRVMGKRCVGFEPYPRMLYRVQQNPMSGKWEVGATRDILSLDKTVVIFNAEEFSRTCQLIVQSEQEYNAARSEGWRDSPKEALAYHEGLGNDIARAAAERAYADRNMSEKAKAEAEKVESGTADHVPEIPAKPVDRMAKARAAKAAKKAEQTKEE